MWRTSAKARQEREPRDAQEEEQRGERDQDVFFDRLAGGLTLWTPSPAKMYSRLSSSDPPGSGTSPADLETAVLYVALRSVIRGRMMDDERETGAV